MISTQIWNEVRLKHELGNFSRLCVEPRVVNGQYRGRCIARILKFLSNFDEFKFGNYRYDEVIIGENKIYKSINDQTLLATYSWFPETDIPKFVFCNELNSLNEKQYIFIDQILNEYLF